MEKEQDKVLLRVENLQQVFKLGRGKLKAVDDISFEIKRGEVFGLVGESGCGKTTTGRSIIRLYDITGGSVYFDGKRICAGTKTYKDKIRKARKEAKSEIAKIKTSQELSEDIKNQEIKKIQEQYLVLYKEQKQEIKKALYDHHNCNKEFVKDEMAKVTLKYHPLIMSTIDKEEKKALQKEYKAQLKLAKKDRIMNKIQMIFQDPIASLDPRMTVRDIIAEGLIIRGIKDKKYIDKLVFEILDMVGLVPEHATRYPHEFSGGQRQRIGIARAIILKPALIIADEPISALDVSIQAQIINLLNELSAKMGLTTLFIAHDLAVVKYFSNRIAVMYYGKIMEMTTSDELFKYPFHPYTKSLLSAIPVPDPYTEKKRKRIVYNPLLDHDYSKEKPTMHEVYPGHLVYCNTKELKEYQEYYANNQNNSL